MNKLLVVVLVPVGVFIALVILWCTGAVLMVAITMIGDSLRSMYVWGTTKLLSTVATLLSDPWKVVALPIAISGVVLAIIVALSQDNPKSDGFVRGRRMEAGEMSRPRYRPPQRVAQRSSVPRPLPTPRPRFGRRK